jgi:hypothetical protein
MRLRTILASYALILLFAVAPIVSVLLATMIARACGAELDEGNVHPCIVAGVNIGEVLYAMFVLGWLALATVPLGVLGLVGFTLAILVMRMRGHVIATRSRQDGRPSGVIAATAIEESAGNAPPRRPPSADQAGD